MSDLVTPGLGDFTVLPISGETGDLIRVGQWLNGDGFHRWEHAQVFVGMADKDGPLGYTMGAYPGGAHLVAVPETQDGWLWSTGHITLSDEQRTAIVANAMACKGIPYGALDYFALAAHRLHVPDVDGELKKHIGNSLICSQLVDRCYDLAGVHLFNDHRYPGYVTPADLGQVIMHPQSIVYAQAA